MRLKGRDVSYAIALAVVRIWAQDANCIENAKRRASERKTGRDFHTPAAIQLIELSARARCVNWLLERRNQS
jgi:hypothetical protein